MTTLAYANGRNYTDANARKVTVISKSKKYGTKTSFALQPVLERSAPIKDRNFR